MKSQLRNHVAAFFLLAPVAIAVTALPATVSAQPATPEVESLEVTSDHGLRPGSRLRFKLEGSPHARASIRIRGTQAMIPLTEVSRGVYTGRYIITRDDRIREGDGIRAIMRRGNRTVTASYSIPTGLDDVASVPADDTRPPRIADLTPREGDTVAAGPPTVVSGIFEDRGGSGVDPASVRILLSGRNVTQDAHVTPQSFAYRAPLPPGLHTVDVTARDRSGNAVRRSWSFEVASQ